MPFGMSPAGWFMWPWLAQWFPYYGYPWYRVPYPGYGIAGYGVPYRVPYAYPPMTKEQETSMLEEQARVLQQQLDQINARLKELQKTK